MTEPAVIARLAALENLCVASLALYLANSRNDPDLSKAKALLAALKLDGLEGIAHLPEPIRRETEAVLSDLVNRVLRMIPALRGDDTQQSH